MHTPPGVQQGASVTVRVQVARWRYRCDRQILAERLPRLADSFACLAQVAEVEVSKQGAVRLRRVVCAVDCSTVIDPDTVKAQIQSGIMFAGWNGREHPSVAAGLSEVQAMFVRRKYDDPSGWMPAPKPAVTYQF